MKFKNSLLDLKKFFALSPLVLTALAAISVAQSQNAREPRREQLLNNLKVLILSDPKAEKTTIKLRVNAGAAFDQAGRTGTMRLLGDIMFPEEETKQFFEEELGGSLNVTTTYDFIEITASGNNDQFERILDAVRTAVTATPLSPENFKKVRDARLRQAQEESKQAPIIADLAVRKRLYGDFPYGRSAGGTPESLAKIEYGDLIVARDRFLNSDYSTLVIVGTVKENYALRAVRQFFGSWKKADKPLLSTFRQPETPDAKVLIVDQADADTAEIRIAVRGLAKNDKDAVAAEIWAKAFARKMQNETDKIEVEHNAHVLPGELIVRASVPTDKAAQTLNALRAAINRAATEKVDVKMFSEAQSELLTSAQNEASKPETAVRKWLDAETFKISSAGASLNLIKSATPTDAERAAARILKNAPTAIIIVGDAEKIQPQVDSTGNQK